MPYSTWKLWCRCNAQAEERTAHLSHRLAAVDAEVDTLKAASTAAAEAAEARLQAAAAAAQRSIREAEGRAAGAQQCCDAQAANVGKQLAVLSCKHAEDKQKLEQEWAAKQAAMESQLGQGQDRMTQAFGTALEISHDLASVDKHLCQVRDAPFCPA